MAFQSGKKKTGGRKPGVTNKKTLLLDSFAQTVVDGGMTKFQTELNKLKGKDYVYAYLTLFEYVKPKLSRMAVEGGDKPVQFEMKNLSAGELKALMAMKKKAMNA